MQFLFSGDLNSGPAVGQQQQSWLSKLFKRNTATPQQETNQRLQQQLLINQQQSNINQQQILAGQQSLMTNNNVNGQVKKRKIFDI